MKALYVAVFLTLCGLLGFLFDDVDAPAIMVGVFALIVCLGEIVYRWEDL